MWRIEEFKELIAAYNNVFEFTLMLTTLATVSVLGIYCLVRAINSHEKISWFVGSIFFAAGFGKIIAYGGEIFRASLQDELAVAILFMEVLMLLGVIDLTKEAIPFAKKLALKHCKIASKEAIETICENAFTDQDAIAEAMQLGIKPEVYSKLMEEIGEAFEKARSGRTVTINLLNALSITKTDFMESYSMADMKKMKKILLKIGFRKVNVMESRPWRIRVML